MAKSNYKYYKEQGVVWQRFPDVATWLLARKLGGSDMGMLTRSNKYDKDYNRWRNEFISKLIGIKPEDMDKETNPFRCKPKVIEEGQTRSMSYGHIHEKEVMERLMKECPMLKGVNATFRHTDDCETFSDELGRTYSHDGLITLPDGRKYICEIKTTRTFRPNMEWTEETFPLMYLYQTLHGLDVLSGFNLDGVIVGVEFRDGNKDMPIQDSKYGITYGNNGKKTFKSFVFKKNEYLNEMKKLRTLTKQFYKNVLEDIEQKCGKDKRLEVEKKLFTLPKQGITGVGGDGSVAGATKTKITSGGNPSPKKTKTNDDMVR